MARLPASIIRKYGVTKKAWQVFRAGRSKPKTHVVRSMARRRYSPRRWFRRRRRSGPRKIPLAPIVGIVASPAVGQSIGHLMSGNINGAMGSIKGLVGCDWNGNFNASLLMQNWTPIIAGAVVHMAANKLGINRAIRKVPMINI